MIGFVKEDAVFDLGTVPLEDTNYSIKGLFNSLKYALNVDKVKPTLKVRVVQSEENVSDNFLELIGYDDNNMAFGGVGFYAIIRSDDKIVLYAFSGMIMSQVDMLIDQAIENIPNQVRFTNITENEDTGNLEFDIPFNEMLLGIKNGILYVAKKDAEFFFSTNLINDAEIVFTNTTPYIWISQNQNPYPMGINCYSIVYVIGGSVIEVDQVYRDNIIDIIDSLNQTYELQYPPFNNSFTELERYVSGSNNGYINYNNKVFHMSTIDYTNSIFTYDRFNVESSTNVVTLERFTLSKGVNDTVVVNLDSFNVGGGGTSENWVTIWENPDPTVSFPNQNDIALLKTLPSSLTKIRITYNETESIASNFVQTLELNKANTFTTGAVRLAFGCYHNISGTNLFISRQIELYDDTSSNPNHMNITTGYRNVSQTTYSAVAIPVKIEAVIPN